MILVREDICVEDVQYGEGMAEVLSLKVKTENKEKRRIIVAYVPPKTNTWRAEQHSEMQKGTIKCLEDMLRRDNKVLLVGDFNCKGIDWKEKEGNNNIGQWGEEMLQMSLENTMEQWVEECTRFREEEEPSILDLVFTKIPEPDPNIKYHSPIGKSDHVVIEMELRGWEQVKRREGYREGRLNYSRTNFGGLRKFFEEVEWKSTMEGKTVQKKYDIFLERYREGVQKYVPLHRIRESKHSWYNARCMEAKRNKDKQWKKMRRQRNEHNIKQYKEARNEYVRIRREEERKFERDIVEKCGEEPKLFYRYINGKITNKETIDKISKGDKTYCKAEEMSEIMNESFKSVFKMEEEFDGESIGGENEGLRVIVVEKQGIREVLEKLDVRKAMGPDEVSAWVLKECAEQLVEPIWDVINNSVKEGEVPREWKRANIVPIYKGGKKTDPLNYRPVSLTSVVGKICEIIIKEKWVEYLENKEIIKNSQYGFRKGRSCVTNLLSFYTRVIDEVQERNGWVDAVYLDIKKAFDTVPHRRLLWKLEHMGGVKGTLLKWMKNYLEDREMRTVIRDTPSTWGEVTSGVPQGSVLAPIMFQVYMNDIQEGLSSYINLFADDAKIMREIKSLDDCLELQRDIDKIWEWSKKWKMEFNAKKCHVMEMGKSCRRPTWRYKMGEVEIKRSEDEKDLGVIIQENLQPEKHINGIFESTRRTLMNIRVAFKYMDMGMMKKIMTAMIRPKLEYAAVVWSPHMKKDIRKLERIQRAATKMVPEIKDFSYEERLRKMGLPTLEDRRERGDLITMYKVVNNIEKIDKRDMVVLRDDRLLRTRGH